MPFSDARIAAAFQNAAFFDAGGFYTTKEMAKIMRARDKIFCALNRSLSPEQYALVESLIRNFVAENALEFRHYFEQGYLACQREKEA